MGPLPILLFNVLGNGLPDFSDACVFVDVELLILETPEKPLGPGVVGGPPLSIHTYPHAMGLHQVQVVLAGKLAALVAVDNVRLPAHQGLLHSPDNKSGIQGVGKLPSHHQAGIPV